MENFVSPVFFLYFVHVEIFKGLFGDGLSQMLLKVLVVDNAPNPLSVRMVGSTGLTEPEIWVFRNVFWNHWLIIS